MSRVNVLVEGQTEQAFLLQLLTPALSAHGVYLHGVLVGKPGHKGGIRSFEAVQRDITSLLKQDKDATVTTLFDRYALPRDWPGLEDSKKFSDLAQAHRVLCKAMHAQVCKAMGSDFHSNRFLPYIQFYEVEAFLFARPITTAKLLGNPTYTHQLQQAVQERGGCEHINDDPSKAPSKRIHNLF
ncbi:MAG TPA: DUF4276 family protein, partial [Nitrososphaera sp.]|nr:DUF4276 family protein [Nitrososphaera sp.]